METCTCDIETYSGNTESVGVMLCNICGKFDTRATENNTILHAEVNQQSNPFNNEK